MISASVVADFAPLLCSIHMSLPHSAHFLGKGLLHASVKPVVVGYWSTGVVMPSPTTSLVTRRPDFSNLITSSDEVSLMNQVIETFSAKDQWILSVCLQDGRFVTLISSCFSLP